MEVSPNFGWESEILCHLQLKCCFIELFKQESLQNLFAGLNLVLFPVDKQKETLCSNAPLQKHKKTKEYNF